MHASLTILKTSYTRPVLCWLLLCAALVACMVLLGGYTRLSGAGLSITQWKPIHGTLPPLNAEAWQEEFDAYRATPQYAKVNAGMTLEAFKTIFWPEFLHRLLGRAMGLAFFAPFLLFALERVFAPRFTLRLLGIFALGGVQGLVGWLMVKSGLVDDPHVSHFRLAAHLALAFALFGLLLWAALDVARPSPRAVPPGMRRSLWGIFGLLCVQIIYGAFMAGLHAGLIYNTFPTMNGAWAPEGLMALNPWWMNPLAHIPTVQFIHRWLAALVVGALIFWWLTYRKTAMNGVLRPLTTALVCTVLMQVALGVATLVLAVPLALAMLHQFTALVLFGLMVATLHGLKEQG